MNPYHVGQLIHISYYRSFKELMSIGVFLLISVIASAICPPAYPAWMPDYTRTDYKINDVARFVYTGTENSDTRPDVIVVDKTGAISVLLAGPNAVFGTLVVTETGLTEPKATVADDFTNDGLTDICINDTLFVATGNGLFAPPKPLGIGRPQTLASTDMNGDGRKDLIAIVIIYTSPTMRAAELRTYFGNGDGTFQEPVKTRINFSSGEVNWQPDTGDVIDDSGSYSIRHVGDFTCDGIPDLVFRRFYLFEWHDLYYNWTYTGASDGKFIRNSLYSAAKGYSTKIHDFNGDGMMDIMEDGGLYTGNNKGQFIYSRGVDSDFQNKIFSITDTNNDGMLDLAFIRIKTDSSSTYCHLVIMPGTKYGTFPDVKEYPIILPANLPYYNGDPFGSYDLNNDGCADFIIPGMANNIATMLSAQNSSNINHIDIIKAAVLGQNTPNPFNVSTSIPYTIYLPGFYELVVYDMLGRKTATFFNRFQTKGEHQIIWNGRDKNGIESASGLYFFVLRKSDGKEVIASKRLLLIR